MRERLYGHCAHVLTEGRRAGEVCGRRYLAGGACERHRPKRTYSGGPRTAEEQRVDRERKARLRATIGVPAGWEV